MKEKILRLIKKKIKREGIRELIQFLENTNYFFAPSPTEANETKVGGLAMHSLEVALLLKQKVDYFGFDYSDETIAICGLFHDLGKVKYGGKLIANQLPMNDIERSIYILTRFIQLTEEEELAIKWHIVAFDLHIHFKFANKEQFWSANPLVSLLFTSNYEVSHILKV